MGAARIPGIVSEEGRYRDASPFVVLDVGRCLRGKAARMRALTVMRGTLRVQPGFGGKTPGEVDPIGEPGVGGCSGREHRGEHPQRRPETDPETKFLEAAGSPFEELVQPELFGACGKCVGLRHRSSDLDGNPAVPDLSSGRWADSRMRSPICSFALFLPRGSPRSSLRSERRRKSGGGASFGATQDGTASMAASKSGCMKEPIAWHTGLATPRCGYTSPRHRFPLVYAMTLLAVGNCAANPPVSGDQVKELDASFHSASRARWLMKPGTGFVHAR